MAESTIIFSEQVVQGFQFQYYVHKRRKDYQGLSCIIELEIKPAVEPSALHPPLIILKTKPHWLTEDTVGCSREDQIHRLCNHDNIIRLFQCEIQRTLGRNDTLYLRMEHCELDLKELMGNGEKKFCEADVVKLARQLVAAFRYLHDNLRILHKDVKPENVFVVRRCSPGEAKLKLGDFSSAAAMAGNADFNFRESFRFTGGGTRGYLSPEMLLVLDAATRYVSSPFPFATDIFSLGIVIFEMATQELPFTNDELKLQADQWRVEEKMGRIRNSMLRDTLVGMLQCDPRDRIRARDLCCLFSVD